MALRGTSARGGANVTPAVFANTQELLREGSIVTKHGAMLKRPVHFRLAEDCRAFIYTTDIGGSKGGTKLLPVSNIEQVTESLKDGPCCFAIHTADRPHKFDAQSPAEKKLWIKAVWDAIALQHYATEQLPMLLAGASMTKHGAVFKRPVWLKLLDDGHHFEYSDYDAATSGFGTKKTLAVGSIQEVLDFGGATLGFDVAGDRVHKLDAESAATKALWLDALRGCLENAKYHGMLLHTATAAASRAVQPANSKLPAATAILRPPASAVAHEPNCSSDDDGGGGSDAGIASARSFDDLRKKYGLNKSRR